MQVLRLAHRSLGERGTASVTGFRDAILVRTRTFGQDSGRQNAHGTRFEKRPRRRSEEKPGPSEKMPRGRVKKFPLVFRRGNFSTRFFTHPSFFFTPAGVFFTRPRGLFSHGPGFSSLSFRARIHAGFGNVKMRVWISIPWGIWLGPYQQHNQEVRYLHRIA